MLYNHAVYVLVYPRASIVLYAPPGLVYTRASIVLYVPPGLIYTRASIVLSGRYRSHAEHED